MILYNDLARQLRQLTNQCLHVVTTSTSNIEKKKLLTFLLHCCTSLFHIGIDRSCFGWEIVLNAHSRIKDLCYFRVTL